VLTLANSVPLNDSTNVALSASAFILLAFNANLDPTTVSSITLTAGGATPVVINPLVQEDDTTSIIIQLDDDFIPDTTYTLSVGTGLKDVLGGSMTTPATLTWSTGAAGNAAPSITAPADQTIAVDGTTGALAVTIGDAETALASLVLTAASSNTALVDAAEITLGGADADRTITVAPKAGQSGTTTITLTVDDGTTTTSATFDITVS